MQPVDLLTGISVRLAMQTIRVFAAITYSGGGGGRSSVDGQVPRWLLNTTDTFPNRQARARRKPDRQFPASGWPKRNVRTLENVSNGVILPAFSHVAVFRGEVMFVIH